VADRSVESTAAGSPPEGTPAPASLRSSWQAPALVGAAALLVSGVVAAIVTAPRPNPAAIFAQTETLVEREAYADALTVLNQRLRPYYEHSALTPEQMRRFHLLRARSVYLGEKQTGVAIEENARTVVQEYTEAAKFPGGTLENRDLHCWADAYVTLGKFDKAMEIAAQLPPSERTGRGRILKRVVEREIASPTPNAEQLLKLLSEFLKDPESTPADRAWALARQAEWLLKQGQTEGAITTIVQTLPSLLTDAPPDELGELYLLLGGAYAETGALAEAGKRLEQATKLLLPNDPKRARALVLMGRVEEQTNPDPAEGKAEAKRQYSEVLQQFAASEARLPALLGLGEVEASLGDADASQQAYRELVQELVAGKRHPDTTVEGVTRSLLDRARARLAAGETLVALSYAELAERLYTAEAAPPDVLVVLAQAHRKAAEEALAAGGVAGSRRLAELANVPPEARERGRQHLVSASGYFKRYADRVGIESNAAFGQALWMAADSLDLAGDPERAIPLFADYVRFFPDDTRQPEARFRLAQAYQSRGDYATAAGTYRELIESAKERANNVGPFADAAHVPLAQCLLLNTDPADDAEAESLLQGVITGEAGGTAAPQFRDGLIEMAALKARRADYAGAIQHMEEAVARFPDDARIAELRYSLADAYRQDARAIAQTLAQSMPDRQRQVLEQTRVERLHKARAGFEQVRQELEARDPRQLGTLEHLQLRNSYFYTGDCAFDLGEFDAAIHHYDAAREKYPSDPASLVAMVQIVNAYVAQKDFDRARTANERAKSFYKSLPPTVWSDPNLPMTNKEWASWLDAMAALMKDHEKTASATGTEP
jgi:tetratricopeptide (TPR) repeat protein